VVLPLTSLHFIYRSIIRLILCELFISLTFPVFVADSGSPCFVYLTLGQNASSTVIVHFHSGKLYQDPVVRYDIVSHQGEVHCALSHSLSLVFSLFKYFQSLSLLMLNLSFSFDLLCSQYKTMQILLERSDIHSLR
jgi:hypothetical protein